jgi:hypothetical protein
LIAPQSSSIQLPLAWAPPTRREGDRHRRLFSRQSPPAGSPAALALLVAAAAPLDFGAQANLVVGFRAIFALGGDSRGRLNGLYIATFFRFDALGSALGA